MCYKTGQVYLLTTGERFAVLLDCIYNQPMITYDEAKRQTNLIKHGLDLADGGIVYDAPNKLTLESPRNGEDRKLDIALVEVMGVVLALVYVERGEEVHAISFRRASRTERRLYAANRN